MMLTMLRLPTVKSRTGLSRSSIYLRISQGSFPKQISLGKRTIGWVESEIEAWLSNQIEQSRNAKSSKAKVIEIPSISLKA
jgi:prophage regulatory protein